MSKMAQDRAEMQQDAEHLTFTEFVTRPGSARADLYAPLTDPEPEYVYPGQDAQT